MTAERTLDYDRMVEDALRGILRRVLTIAADEGLPGEHHVYVTFLTRHPGVELPPRLLNSYPDEMTIVLQYEFWGLEVTEEAFQVWLSFNEREERIRVPFAAVTAFADPFAKFGLQFASDDDETDTADDTEDAATAPPDIAPAPDRDRPARTDTPDGTPAEGGPEEDDKVVSIEDFRHR